MQSTITALFCRGGIADSQRENGLAWSRTCTYLITEWSPEGLSIVIPPPHPLLFALILLLGVFLAGGTWRSWDGGGGKEEEHICTGITLRNRGSSPSGNKDLAFLEVSDSRSCCSLSASICCWGARKLHILLAFLLALAAYSTGIPYDL